MLRLFHLSSNFMRTLIIALASALLLAALVTEVTARFFPGSYLALLIVTAIALLVNGLFNVRLAGAPGAAAGAAPQRGDKSSAPNQREQRGERDRKPRKREDQQSDNNRQSNGPRKPRTSNAPAAAASGPTEEGTVKWFNRTKGYGFIIRENEEEIFVHQRSIIGDDANTRAVLRDGQRVRFTLAKHEKGDQAENVTGLD
jgi:cold shock CspA family protein